MAATGETFETQRAARRFGFRSWRWSVTALIVIAVVIAGLLLAYRFRETKPERGTRALVEAFTKTRLIEARLSGGFRGGEFRPSLEVPADIDAKLVKARELITDAMTEDEGTARLAYARLLLSKSEKLPEALKYLRRAVASSPDSADAHNDLGVCFIQQDKPEDAIEEFENSLKLKPDMPEALFNRAFCYRRLLLRDSASADLSRLLEVERDSSWRDEIKSRLAEVCSPLAPGQKEAEIIEALHASVLRQDADEIRRITDLNFEVSVRHALLKGPVEYLKEAVAANTARADSVVSELNWIARQAESRGDKSVSEMVSHLTGLPRERLQDEFDLVSDFQTTVDEKLGRAKRYSEAETALQRLSGAFAHRGNTLFQTLSDAFRANCLYADSSLLASSKVLQKAIASTEGSQWPFLRTMLLCQLSGTYARLDQDSLAITGCERAKEYGRGMPLLQAKAAQYLGNTYWRLGNLDKALSELLESTKLYLGSVPSIIELANNYLQIADIYRLSGNHRLAMLFAKQALDLSRLANDFRRAAQASSFIAVENAKLEQWEQADERLKNAFADIDVSRPDPSSYTELLVLSRAGEVATARGDTETAVQNYSRAEALSMSGEEKTIPLLRVLRGRADTFARAQRFTEARADLERAINKIETYRAGIADNQDRSAFLDASQAVFDQMMLLNIAIFHNTAAAFELSEQSRARVLLDQLSADPSRLQQEPTPGARAVPGRSLQLRNRASLPSLAQVQASLGDDLKLLSYAVTNQRTYLFLITRDALQVFESPATTEMLDRLAQDYVSVLENPDAMEEAEIQGRKLYEYLIKPIEGSLTDGKALCIIPDKALHFLPFAALVDGSGRYFVETQRLTYAPSASVLVRSLEEARLKPVVAEESILAVGNPLFNRTTFPLLKNLADAEQEAKQCAASYSSRSLIIGAEATESEVRAQLKKCDVAHFAVHCIVAEKSPWLAALVLTRQTPAIQRRSDLASGTTLTGDQSSSEDGLLYLNEIYDVSFPHARLVVLSACETGLGQYYRGEGIVSLIRPFLAARVPSVVASLWSVDSRATAELMIGFHRERRAHNVGPGDALRAAQIKMIRSAEFQHPYYWAPFISVGAN